MKWDLTKLYKTLKEWEKALGKVEETIEKLGSFQGKLDKFESFKEYYTLQKELGIDFIKVYQYAALTSDLNKKNTENAARVQRMALLASKLGQVTAFESPELLTIGQEVINSFIQKDETLKEYKFSLEKLFRLQEHVLDAKSETILANYSQLSGQGSEVYTALSVADKVDKEVTLTSGETVLITSGNYRSFLADLESPKDREIVFKSIFSQYKDKKNAYAQIYNTILQANIASMKNRKYSSSLESYLFRNNIPLDVYHNLVAVAKENTAPIKRYYQMRKEFLGLEKHHTYDRFIPLASGNSKFTYEEAKDLFFKSIAHLDEEFQSKAKTALEDGYVDVYEHEGKQTGAYSWGAINEHPYILLNYDDTLNNVFTVAHEAGHSMHSMFSAESQPVATQNYTIFVAEIASTFNEHNLLDYFIKNSDASKEDKIQLLQQSVDDILGTFYRQTLFAAYELKAHELAEQGTPITYETLSGIMVDLYKEFYDIDITEEDGKEFVWAYIPHLFYTPFYVYQYATSFAASLKLYEMVQEDKSNIKNHIGLLRSGGNDYPVNQVKKAGVDLTTKEPFKAVVNRLNKLLDELEVALKE
ncbi:Oligoendopeptidase F, plasmid [Candidatus Izimaplasma bacterium HR1]|jgi:oligoendopeptidase F|uniref:oligoendopeptidase F n=1 Tax=Candidatus Izimoplasma sp. HR1 TaxID=1541959 RepID=UPI0004F85719|nr:Oligoendopeptidase F, plasmid [Candidatus Izimaplasma bacterium HR1]